MTMNRHEPFEELISASLSGDLTDAERQRLDAHLDACAECRGTLAAFADQRRIVAGLRHLAPPRDLGARVRTGIEGGRAGALPWWRRPAAIFAGVGGGLAVVAGALLALVLLNGSPDDPQIGAETPSPTATFAVPSPSPSEPSAPTLPPIVAPTAEASPGESAEPPPSVEPTPTPVGSPEPDVFLALTGPLDNAELSVRDGSDVETALTDAETPAGEPIAAELSPDGEWLAYVTSLGLSGMNEVRATRIAGGEGPAIGATYVLGQSIAGGPFLEHLFWSGDGRQLAFTVADPEGGGTDVWIFEPDAERSWQLTDVGNAYAGSWVAGRPGSEALWVSMAGERPVSYLLSVDANDEAINPADSEFPAAENAFQPIVSPNGAFVIYWTGSMERAGDEWEFTEAGMPWLAENGGDGDGGYEFEQARPLYSDVTIDREAFNSAAIAWGPDSDAYAVWDAAWTGPPQSTIEDYPVENRVYFGHATDPRGLTRVHAIDAGDLPADAYVVDVKVSPTGRHLVITAGRPRPGDLSPPLADLFLITRNTGDLADEVEVIRSGDDGWYGPAAFIGHPRIESP